MIILIHWAILAQLIDLEHSKRGVPVLLIMPQRPFFEVCCFKIIADNFSCTDDLVTWFALWIDW